MTSNAVQRPQTPGALRVAAPWTRLRCSASSTMTWHRLDRRAWHPGPRRSQRDPRDFYHGLLGLSLAVCFTQLLFAQEIPGAEKQDLIFPIVVLNGDDPELGEFQTIFTFLSLSNTTGNATFVVHEGDGTPIPVFADSRPPGIEIRNDTEAYFDLPPNGAKTVWITPRTPVNGWARLTYKNSGKVQGIADLILRNEPCITILITGVPPCYPPSSEVVFSTVQVRAVQPAREFRAQAMITFNRHSAFAIVNPSPTQTAVVDLTILDSSGENLDGNQFAIQPQGRISELLWKLLIHGKIFITRPRPPDDFEGSVRLTSSIPIAVAGLHVLLPEAKFLNLPVETIDSSTPGLNQTGDTEPVSSRRSETGRRIR